LDQRRVIVVGAGTTETGADDGPLGNGRAIALALAARGATVVCVDVNPASAAHTAALIAAEGGTAHVVVVDVSSADECERMMEESTALLGGLDGLVLNVGTGMGFGLQGTSADEWDATFAVNLRSHFLAARAALRTMARGSAIVFIGSIAAKRPGSGVPAYDASKAALPALCRHVALEGAPLGIRANVVEPGLIDTPLGRLAGELRAGRASTPIPLGRQGAAEEVASTVAFVLSDDASYITGQVIAVDGGVSTLVGSPTQDFSGTEASV